MINDKSFSYSFHPAVVLRTPRFSFSSDWDEQVLTEKLSDPVFMEAIYMASPTLHKACLKLKNGCVTEEKSIQKIYSSLIKYLSRMSSRSTPFGLFSGISVLEWKTGKTNAHINPDHAQRHTRLDMHYLCALAEQLSKHKFIRTALIYYPNSSLYPLSKEFRYVEYQYLDNRRVHQVSAVDNSFYLMQLVEAGKSGLHYTEMIAFLKNKGVAEAEALNYVEELLDAQVFVTELEAAVTGKEFIYQILSSLRRILTSQQDEFTSMVYHTLLEVDLKLKEIDKNGTNESDVYEAIEQLLDRLGIPYEQGKLFQADLHINARGSVNQELQNDLKEAVCLLNAFNNPVNHPNLSDFKRRFRERYEDKFMPLLEALDIESGLGYIPGSHEDVNPLIEGIRLPAPLYNYQQDENQMSALLWRKIIQATAHQQYEMEIEATEVRGLQGDWTNKPPSMSVIFRILGEADRSIFLEGCSGTSAVNLLGRFSHLDQKIDHLIVDITEQEKLMNKGVVFAEIIHLPESRTGNILQRKIYRDYEIPYLGKSALNPEKQIQASDLYIGIRDNKIVLFSKKLNKVVIPRLSTAHNYSNLSLPVYQFLCDLQSQGLMTSLHFNWGNIAGNFQFLPRVKFKNIILSAAQWQLKSADISCLMDVAEEDFKLKINEFRSIWNLPRYVTLADNDNELLIDFDNPLTIKSWLKLVKNRASLILKESLFSLESGITSERGGIHANQMIASIVKQERVYQVPVLYGLKQDSLVIRKFEPGSEWLYYKLYCGTKSADTILSEVIQPLVEELKHKEYIDQWFFIRYNDPDFHLRIRFHLKDVKDMGGVIQTLNKYMANAAGENIWKTQIDTYQRETERYGIENIEIAEALFYADSETFLGFLSLTAGDEREELRWIWGMRNIDALLTDFQYSLDEKIVIVRSIKDAFRKELNPEKSVKEQVNKKFAENEKLIWQMMDHVKGLSDPLSELMKLTDHRSEANRPFIEALMEVQLVKAPEITINSMIGHVLHMSLNRLFLSEARIQEMVIYDLMDRYYTSLKARMAQYLKKTA